ncbi:multicopper oxidase family protein [Natronorarus salvus]|uniref:multicopper oxidase family protein n=1 Tax=Natronorarus salvus TaxID=3117733 RepID=UPI002F265285
MTPNSQIDDPDHRSNDPWRTSRRRWLQGVGALGSAALFGVPGAASEGGGSHADGLTIDHCSPDLEPFVDDLPIPPLLESSDGEERARHGATYYEVAMTEFTQRLHRDLPETTLWGYEGTYPGPTIEVEQNERVDVLWRNDLPDEHLLPLDTTLHGAGERYPAVRTVVHLHGGATEPESDGYPEAWFTRGFEQTGDLFRKRVYEYDNTQPPATLWYHDHALGITRLNVYAGLAGAYLVRDPKEERYDLPSGRYEIPLIVQDRSFDEDGSLFYPEGEDGEGLPSPSVVPEFFGDTAVVNGKVWPKLDVEPRKYRFRMINGSNSRFYDMQLTEFDSDGAAGPEFVQIGSDGGFLNEPVTIDERLLLGPAERADVIVDFSGFAGRSLLLHNDAPTPFPFGGDDAPLPKLMRFDVADKSVDDESRIPSTFTVRRKKDEKNDDEKVKKGEAVPEIPEGDAVVERNLALEEATDEFDRLLLLLDGLEWDDPITEKPTLGTTEIWNLVNLTEDTHPIHLHAVQFQVLGRQPFDVAEFEASGEVVPTGDEQPPEPNEGGWKDTVNANPEEVTRIIAHFGKFDGLFADHPGEFVWHCHILEHEDHEMMRPYVIVEGEKREHRDLKKKDARDDEQGDEKG